MQTQSADNARVLVLPPVILATALALGTICHLIWPMQFIPSGYAVPSGLFLMLASIPIVAVALWQLAKSRTAFDVRKPTTSVVSDGIFSISRNPTYLSMIVGFVGVATLIDSLWMLLLAFPLAFSLQKFVIEPEERYLERKFGQGYRQYKAAVRRWI